MANSQVKLADRCVEGLDGAQPARAIEPLCILWCVPGSLKNDWFRAFKMLR